MNPESVLTLCVIFCMFVTVPQIAFGLRPGEVIRDELGKPIDVPPPR